MIQLAVANSTKAAEPADDAAPAGAATASSSEAKADDPPTLEPAAQDVPKTKPEDGAEQARDFQIQRLFDMTFISLVTVTGPSTAEAKAGNKVTDQPGCATAIAELETDTSLKLEDLERLRKDAIGYWKRMHLLCGLL